MHDWRKQGVEIGTVRIHEITIIHAIHEAVIKVGLAGSLYSAGGTLERGNVQVK